MSGSATPASIEDKARRYLGRAAVCILLAATAVACTGGDDDTADQERPLDLATQVHALEASLEALAAENAELKGEVAALRQQQADFVEAQEAAAAAREHEEEVADFGDEQGAQLIALEEGQARSGERLDEIEARLRALEQAAPKPDAAPAALEQPSDGKDEPSPEGASLERIAGLVEAAGGELHSIEHPDRSEPALLLVPREFVTGETPLIVSLHGFGGDAADHARSLPLHERVDRDGFALLLPNGQRDGAGTRFWNPTDRCCAGGKSGEDDVAYLTDLVARARQVEHFGPLYFFGYSNGGFMAYHMACKGLPGLRAVASLAGTSYVEDSACDGAPPVSVLHLHGTADDVILIEGDESDPDAKDNGEAAFYAGARDMVTRWSQRAGCEWPQQAEPEATLDLDPSVPGAETQVFRLESGCAAGITIELWTAIGGGHAPAYGDAFVDALIGWLLSQG